MSQFFTSGGQSIEVYLQQSLKEIRCQQKSIFEKFGINELRLCRKQQYYGTKNELEMVNSETNRKLDWHRGVLITKITQGTKKLR